MKNPKAPRLVTVAILTTITVVFWVFLSVYRVLTTKPEPNVPPEILAPINPNLDKQTLETLSDRVFFEEGEVTLPAPLPTATLTPVQQKLPEEIVTPTATPSALQEEP